MIRIASTQAAFDAIAATLPLGSVGYEVEADASRRFCRSLDDGPLPHVSCGSRRARSLLTAQLSTQ
jgi:hypothetical protein